MKKTQVIDALPGDKLAGLQIDLLKKISNGGRTLEELEWFLKLPKRDLLQGLGKLSFRVSPTFENRQMFSGALLEHLIAPNYGLFLSANIDYGTKLFSAQGRTRGSLPQHPKFQPVGEKIALILLYLLVVYPIGGKAVLNYDLDESTSYSIFVNNVEGEGSIWELSLQYLESLQEWKIEYRKFEDDLHEVCKQRIVLSVVPKNR